MLFTARRILLPVLAKASQYNRTLFSDRYLLATNIGLSVSLSAIGDALEQFTRLSRGTQEKYNYERTKKMGTCAVSFGIVCHYWYLWLDRFIPGASFRCVMKKVVWDQILLSPVMWAVYFATLGVYELSGWQKFQDRLFSKNSAFSSLYLAEWVVWPPAQAFNFYVLPTRYRVLYDNLVSVGFDWYTSFLVNDKDEDGDDDD